MLHLCCSFIVTLFHCSSIYYLQWDAISPKLIQFKTSALQINFKHQLTTDCISSITAPIWVHRMEAILQEQWVPEWLPPWPVAFSDLLLHLDSSPEAAGLTQNLLYGPSMGCIPPCTPMGFSMGFSVEICSTCCSWRKTAYYRYLNGLQGTSASVSGVPPPSPSALIFASAEIFHFIFSHLSLPAAAAQKIFSPFLNMLLQRQNQHLSLALLWTAAGPFWNQVELACIYNGQLPDFSQRTAQQPPCPTTKTFPCIESGMVIVSLLLSAKLCSELHYLFFLLFPFFSDILQRCFWQNHQGRYLAARFWLWTRAK